MLNTLPKRNVYLLKKPYQIFPKARVPRQNDHPWCRMVSYGARVIGACDHVTHVAQTQTRNLKEITRLMTSPAPRLSPHSPLSTTCNLEASPRPGPGNN